MKRSFSFVCAWEQLLSGAHKFYFLSSHLGTLFAGTPTTMMIILSLLVLPWLTLAYGDIAHGLERQLQDECCCDEWDAVYECELKHQGFCTGDDESSFHTICMPDYFPPDEGGGTYKCPVLATDVLLLSFFGHFFADKIS